jgi:predicted transcriptional regulator YheO
MSHPLKPFKPVCDAIATLFSPHVEAVLHDLEAAAGGQLAQRG